MTPKELKEQYKEIDKEDRAIRKEIRKYLSRARINSRKAVSLMGQINNPKNEKLLFTTDANGIQVTNGWNFKIYSELDTIHLYYNHLKRIH